MVIIHRFINSTMDKSFVYAYSGILYNSEKECIVATCNKRDEFHRYHIETEEAKYRGIAMVSLICIKWKKNKNPKQESQSREMDIRAVGLERASGRLLACWSHPIF